MTRWRIFITSAADRALKKLPKDAQRFVFHDFPEIIRGTPFAGEQLTGPLAWLRSFHFTTDGQLYRIAYGVNRSTFRIVIHFVSHRSGFYERLRKKLRH